MIDKMIDNKNDLKIWLKMDARANGRPYTRMSATNLVWDFIWILRHHELYENKSKNTGYIFGGKYIIMRKLYSLLHLVLGYILGFSIPCNVFGPGLRINHYGLVIVNPNSKIGAWCDIHQGVNIGENFDKKSPIIGTNVWIGPGAKIFGDIKIADNICIGANSVVGKSFIDPNVTIAGIPAKIIKEIGNPYRRE